MKRPGERKTARIAAAALLDACLVACLVATGLVAATAPLRASDWRQFRNDPQMTGSTDGSLPDACDPYTSN